MPKPVVPTDFDLAFKLMRSAQCRICKIELGNLPHDPNHHMVTDASRPELYRHYCEKHCPECRGRWNQNE